MTYPALALVFAASLSSAGCKSQISADVASNRSKDKVPDGDKDRDGIVLRPGEKSSFEKKGLTGVRVGLPKKSNLDKLVVTAKKTDTGDLKISGDKPLDANLVVALPVKKNSGDITVTLISKEGTKSPLSVLSRKDGRIKVEVSKWGTIKVELEKSDSSSANSKETKTAPQAPASLSVARGNQTANLDWDGVGADAKYLITRAIGENRIWTPKDGTQYEEKAYGSISVVYLGSNTTFEDTSLSNGTKYFYRVYSYNEDLLYSDPRSASVIPELEGAWTWMQGTSTGYDTPVYGTLGESAESNSPGGRNQFAHGTDADGNLVIFGGFSPPGELTDTWEFDGELWTWVSGSDQPEEAMVPGTQGVPDPANMPGSRNGQTGDSDPSGNFWVFGGWGHNPSDSGVVLNDLWRYDGSAWTWISGDVTGGESGSYGSKGVADPANVPGAREGARLWFDHEGTLWLFAGARGGDRYNDVWMFDGTNWTWMAGNNGPTSAASVYGTQGIYDSSNTPSARYYPYEEYTVDEKLVVFGGRGYDQNGTYGYLNDLWYFNGSEWAWIGGTKDADQAGVYGTKGVADGANLPGGRYKGVTWTDAEGLFWLFGGYGYDSSGTLGRLNDLWKYDGDNWTWVAGTKTADSSGVYGEKGVASLSNTPGGRQTPASWVDPHGNLWLYAGYGKDSEGTTTDLSDVWKFVPR